MSSPAEIRSFHKRRRVIFKRDYNREIEEVNRIIKLTCNLENVETLESVRISMIKTKTDLEATYLGILDTTDDTKDEDKKLEDEILKERDNYFMNLDRAVGLCTAFRKKLEGNHKRESLNASVAGTSTPSSARLPKINVPKFNGDLRQFLDFKALFENLVHNDDEIPPVRKMHYLKESLIDEASKTLANISVSEDGYREAWGRVLTKYNNKRIIIHTHFNDLFSAARIRSENNLRQLLDQVDVSLRGLRACGETTDRWSSILAYIVYTRLDPKTRTDFDNNVSNNSTYFSFKDLIQFCENRASNVEARKVEEGPTASMTFAPNRTNDPKRSFFTSKLVCIVCQGQHLLIDCSEFMSKSPVERLHCIQNGKLCTNCFSRSHITQNCPSNKSCKICQQRHHYLVHLSDTTARLSTNPPPPSPPMSSNTCSTTRRFIVLPSAKVRFGCGKIVGNLRILLDNCSQPTLLSDTLVRKLKLPTSKNPTNSPIRGIGFESVGTPRSCKLQLASRINPFTIDVEADVIPATAIPYMLNSLRWNEEFEKISKLELADPAFYSKVPTIPQVDMILGAQYVERCMLNETIQFKNLILRRTQFGWTLNGEFPTNQTPQKSTTHHCCFTTTSIDQQLARLFDFAETEDQEPTVTDKFFCEEHFLQNMTRNENGHFVLKLPFVMSPKLLGTNRNKAIAILHHCQKRAEPQLWTGYTNFMTEYETLGHMKRTEPDTECDYVIPHHAVLRPDSTTTKIRVVFNASSKSSTGYSLNDLLAVGPQIQPDLFDAIVRFRTYTIAVTADIAMMYRCIQIHPDDHKYQQIVWRPNSSEPLQNYQLTTVTYGTSSAPFLAVRCLHELAHSIQQTDPLPATVIKNHFYMDDLITGANTIQEATYLRTKIHETLAGAGFILRKYQSNSAELLASIPTSLVQPATVSSIHPQADSAILGLGWNRKEDVFHVRVIQSDLVSSSIISKRQLLSEISKVFDPLGLLAPVVIRAKLLIQKVWLEKTNWDDPVSHGCLVESQKYLSDLPQLTQISLDRPYTKSDFVEQKLFGFCDASEKAYCAVVYIGHFFPNQPPIIQFVASRTRIAPIKTSTIPRLELQAAVLLTTLVQKLCTPLQISKEKICLFSDSQVVLAWLAKPTNPWTIFVRNRVQKICEQFPASKWSYISTNSNPADLATRGISASEFVKSSLWMNGPTFLKSAETYPTPECPTTNAELQEIAGTSCTTTTVVNRSITDRISSYKLFLQVLGRVILFTRKWREARPNKVMYNPDNRNLFIAARTSAILLLQAQAFSKELEALRTARPLPINSPIGKLEPFLDQDGILRTTGRLANAEYSFAKRHPIIIPRNCHFMRQYIQHLHHVFCHANKGFIISFILAEFWVCGGLHTLIKSVISTCVTCARYRAETYSQIMGQLPSTRTTVSRPFANVGIDFCGPFNCRCLGHRSLKINKIYACIYVCMTTRAVHIEVVSNLTTTNFLMALHRFIARRGLPTTIHSDCGTNFTGANNYIDLADKSIQEDSIVQPVTWIFNPPRAPHRGGIWEAAVKAAKTHLTRVIGLQTMNFEEYTTLFTRIESILNSRPLCYRIQQSVGEFILTPSHFLIGSLTYTLPEPEDSKLPLWKRYDLLRILLQSFWRTWRADYLNMLQTKSKWKTTKPNIKEGQVVLLKSEAPPGAWPYAIVASIHPDSLGNIRTVTVRTSAGAEYRRDIRTLVKLPLSPEEDSHLVGGSVDTATTSTPQTTDETTDN